ncbi:class I SAM-dependent methyltransferase [Hymenobacter latericus]|uniref:class I SAM-dependent methyltransferase n=1 Tax=Hymenobacter sp. YIM 151858-1 TaxID=2987688 RepID=UPI002227A3EA|nr:class I SAM-dependent methyltransferase [Hymenobacter sp. YIM 151858-1]UYZ61007.1 class I SAM-dependent methyltransferase [Hymenobacter sp. YIM 151858-1]
MPTPNFDRVARFYDPLSQLVFGTTLLQAQCAALAEGLPAGAPRVLFIGGGSGEVLPKLVALRPMAEVLYLEASAAMLAQAQARVRELPGGVARRISFRHGSETSLRANEQFDAVVAFFLFDLFPEPELAAMLNHLRRHTHAGTQWLVADFTPPQRWWQRGLHWLMYTFFGLTAGVRGRRLPNIAAAMATLGLAPRWQQHWRGGLVEASVYGAPLSPKQ